MIEAGITDGAGLESVQAQVEEEVIAAVDFARQAPYPDPQQAFEDLYA